MRLVLAVLFILSMLPSPAYSAATASEARATRAMVLTFDDLPYAASSTRQDTVPEIRSTTDAILAALKKHNAPAVALVNEAKLHAPGEFIARRAILQQWADAGVILGNHTFSHADLNKITIEQFKNEIINGEAVTRQIMMSHRPYQPYFRHPYTHTGDSKTKKEKIDRFLESRGYKVAPYTIDSQDYVFNAVYLHAKEQGNVATATRVCEAYLDFVIRATEFAEDTSAKIFEREIPQTLLLHANDLNAGCLDTLLVRVKQRGYEFVSLDTATSDPAYKSQDTLVTAYGPSWLWRWMKSRDMDISFRGDPEPPDWIANFFQQASSEAH